jgi:hypothetical protein
MKAQVWHLLALAERKREREREQLQNNEIFIWSHILMKVSFVLQFFKDFITQGGFRTLIIIGLNFELWHKGVVEPLDGGWWVVLNRCKDSLIKFEMMIW